MSGTVPESEFMAVLRMLVRRATIYDRWLARRRRGHWLNQARRQILVYESTRAGVRFS